MNQRKTVMFRIVKQIVQIKRIPFKEHWFLIDGSIIVILENNENILFLKIFYYFSSVTTHNDVKNGKF